MKKALKYVAILSVVLLYAGFQPIFLDSKEDALSHYEKEKIKRLFIKNIAISKAYYSQAMKEKVQPNLLSYQIGSFPDFGYMNGNLEWDVSYSKKKYPDTLWKLVEIHLANNSINDTILSKNTNAGLSGGQYLKNSLIAINRDHEIKFISGRHLNHSVARDFQLDKETPESYVQFMNLKLFNKGYEKIDFLSKKGDVMAFIAYKNDKKSGAIYEEKWTLDVNNPDALEVGEIKIVNSGIGTRKRVNYSLEEKDKKGYLFNALMKNIYLYRCHHLPNFIEEIKLDTIQKQYRFNSFGVNDLLPDYDEYLDRMNIVKINLRYTDINCRNVVPSFQNAQLNENSYDILFKSFSDDIEFYHIYKDTVETLVQRRNGDYKNGGRIRYDTYYQPEVRLRNEESLKKNNIPLIPPPAIPGLHFNEGNPQCTFYNPDFSDKWKGRMDYYLIALNVKTREVRFISGKDIYLSRAIDLHPPKNKRKTDNIEKWELPYKLQYIKDRLYHYQVSDVSERHIVKRDDEKLVLNVTGTEYGKEIKLEVIFYNDNPEVLSIEKI